MSIYLNTELMWPNIAGMFLLDHIAGQHYFIFPLPENSKQRTFF